MTATGVDERNLRSLRGWNTALGALHLGQAVAAPVIATDFAITATSRCRPARLYPTESPERCSTSRSAPPWSCSLGSRPLITC